jgi:hypothetical protein
MQHAEATLRYLLDAAAGESQNDFGATVQTYQRRELVNASQSSLNGTNGTNQTVDQPVFVPPVIRPVEGVLVLSPPCEANSQCFNAIGSYQVDPLVWFYAFYAFYALGGLFSGSSH